MKKGHGCIFALLVLLTFTFSCRRVRVIPEDVMSQMYLEMFLLDQWVIQESISTKADTSFVYGTVIRNHGYTVDDFRHSVNTYLKNPEGYAKILDETLDMITGRMMAIDEQGRANRRRDSIRVARLAKYLPDPPNFSKYKPGPYDPVDTVIIGRDSLKYLMTIPKMDTMYHGPRMILQSDIDRADSLKAVEDSLKALADSLGKTLVTKLNQPGGKKMEKLNGNRPNSNNKGLR